MGRVVLLCASLLVNLVLCASSVRSKRNSPRATSFVCGMHQEEQSSSCYVIELGALIVSSKRNNPRAILFIYSKRNNPRAGTLDLCASIVSSTRNIPRATSFDPSPNLNQFTVNTQVNYFALYSSRY